MKYADDDRLFSMVLLRTASARVSVVSSGRSGSIKMSLDSTSVRSRRKDFDTCGS